MPSCNKTYSVTEYSGFTRGTATFDYQALPEKTFDSLESFILANTNTTDTEAIELLSLSARRSVGKIITARNYVGLITMTDGTVIEILLKIAGKNITKAESKQILLEMLKTLNDVTFKDFNISKLNTDRMSLFEIFIKMFIDEVITLTKQGLKSTYTPVDSNERFYKGKLLASQNIKYNLVNKERFYIQYDDFNINRPENKLIKSTLKFLFKVTNDARNRHFVARLLTYFEDVDYSRNYDADLSKCLIDRSMNHYNKVISWCRIFLRGNSFTSFTGSEVGLALLFPMEKLFESFVAAKLRKLIESSSSMCTQDRRYSLFDKPSRSFLLCPDIVLEDGEHTVLLDTKWKLLSDNARNSGISQSDMYQMYAYSKKYEADKIILVYPQSDDVTKLDIRYSSNDNVKLSVSFVDLRNIDESILELLSKVYK